MMIETLNDIIGQRGDPEISKRIKHLVNQEPEVRGAYDLTLFNYGPDKHYGSVHIELPDTMTVDEVDALTRKIQLKVFQNTGVILTGVGVYSYNTTNDEAAVIRNTIQKKIMSHDWALQMHGFYVDTINKTIRFDVVVSFDIDHREALSIMQEEVQELYPDYAIHIVPDVDVSD
jgi:divalent metal cation (Fe/Co/Zn/Cd) transporter